MKNILLGASLVFLTSACTAQSFQLEQLALDIQKLAELKNILSDLYKGYAILSNGYETIRSLSQGNFSLHKTFLDGLLAVSPAVQQYVHVADIITNQASLVSEYRKAFSRFSKAGGFTAGEINYFSTVYSHLLSESVKNMTDLTNVLTDGALRMSDDERMESIDDIYKRSEGQLQFLRSFNSGAAVLGLQRAMENNQLGTIHRLYGLDQ